MANIGGKGKSVNTRYYVALRGCVYGAFLKFASQKGDPPMPIGGGSSKGGWDFCDCEIPSAFLRVVSARGEKVSMVFLCSGAEIEGRGLIGAGEL